MWASCTRYANRTLHGSAMLWVPHYNTNWVPHHYTNWDPHYNTNWDPHYNTNWGPHYNTNWGPHYNTNLPPLVILTGTPTTILTCRHWSPSAMNKPSNGTLSRVAAPRRSLKGLCVRVGVGVGAGLGRCSLKGLCASGEG